MDLVFVVKFPYDSPITFEPITAHNIVDPKLRGQGPKLVNKTLQIYWQKKVHDGIILECGTDWGEMEMKACALDKAEQERQKKIREAEEAKRVTEKRQRKKKVDPDFVDGNDARKAKEKTKKVPLTNQRKLEKFNAVVQMGIENAQLALPSATVNDPQKGGYENTFPQSSSSSSPPIFSYQTDSQPIEETQTSKHSEIREPENHQSVIPHCSNNPPQPYYNQSTYSPAYQYHGDRQFNHAPVSDPYPGYYSQPYYPDFPSSSEPMRYGENSLTQAGASIQSHARSTPPTDAALNLHQHHQAVPYAHQENANANQPITSPASFDLEEKRKLEQRIEELQRENDEFRNGAVKSVRLGPNLIINSATLQTMENKAGTAAQLARNLFSHFFTTTELKTHSLNGKPCNANKGRNCPVLPALDENRSSSLIEYALKTHYVCSIAPNPSTVTKRQMDEWTQLKTIVRREITDSISNYLYTCRKPRTKKKE